MEQLKLNKSTLLGKMVGEWKICEIHEQPLAYVISLQKESVDRVFFINKRVIKGISLNLPHDVYELWDNDYKDAKILTLSEILNEDTLINTIKSMIEKYL